MTTKKRVLGILILIAVVLTSTTLTFFILWQEVAMKSEQLEATIAKMESKAVEAAEYEEMLMAFIREGQEFDEKGYLEWKCYDNKELSGNLEKALFNAKPLKIIERNFTGIKVWAIINASGEIVWTTKSR